MAIKKIHIAGITEPVSPTGLGTWVISTPLGAEFMVPLHRKTSL